MKKTLYLAAAMVAAQIGAAQADDIDPRAAEKYRPSQIVAGMAGQPEAIINIDAINPELPGFTTFAIIADIRSDLKKGYRVVATTSSVGQDLTACITRITRPNGDYTTAPEGACLGKLVPVVNVTTRLNIKSNGLPAGTPFVLVPDEVGYPKGAQFIGTWTAN